MYRKKIKSISYNIVCTLKWNQTFYIYSTKLNWHWHERLLCNLQAIVKYRKKTKSLRFTGEHYRSRVKFGCDWTAVTIEFTKQNTLKIQMVRHQQNSKRINQFTIVLIINDESRSKSSPLKNVHEVTSIFGRGTIFNISNTCNVH